MVIPAVPEGGDWAEQFADGLAANVLGDINADGWQEEYARELERLHSAAGERPAVAAMCLPLSQCGRRATQRAAWAPQRAACGAACLAWGHPSQPAVQL